MKLYPTLPPSAPEHEPDRLAAPQEQESQVYRLKKIEEIEQYLRSEIKEREKLYKKFKLWGMGLRYADHGMIAVTVITSAAGIATLATGFGAPIAIGFEVAALAVGMGQVGLKNASKRLEHKVHKHECIKLLAESKLDTVYDKISKAIQDGTISDYEFTWIMQEKQRYMVLKEQIRQRTKKAVKSINDNERAELLAQGRQEAKDEIFKKLQSAQYVSAT